MRFMPYVTYVSWFLNLRVMLLYHLTLGIIYVCPCSAIVACIYIYKYIYIYNYIYYFLASIAFPSPGARFAHLRQQAMAALRTL